MGKPFSLRSGKAAGAALLVFCWAALASQADDILFIGNSFTFVGKIPNIVERIALAKGKPVSTLMVATGGKSWAWHLQNPATDRGLKAKLWNWVVLQDYSTEATHVGVAGEFNTEGAAFYNRIVQEAPQANIVLYQTWAYAARNPIFTGKSTAKTFANPDEMIGEIEKNYAALQTALEARDPKRQVLLAPVGTAFARCVKEHPEINLYFLDFKHPSPAGSYLSALVIYATIFRDTPEGAPQWIPGLWLRPKVADILQTVAAEVTQK